MFRVLHSRGLGFRAASLGLRYKGSGLQGLGCILWFRVKQGPLQGVSLIPRSLELRGLGFRRSHLDQPGQVIGSWSVDVKHMGGCEN